MAGMSMPGMDMGLPPVTIPKGVIYTEADVRFMQGMIAHHAQAIYMSRLAAAAKPTRACSSSRTRSTSRSRPRSGSCRTGCSANKQFAPDTSSWRTMTMPGMLTEAQLATLDAAKGTDFDRAFLNLMIQHHKGALKMVADLLAVAARGAGRRRLSVRQ